MHSYTPAPSPTTTSQAHMQSHHNTNKTMIPQKPQTTPQPSTDSVSHTNFASHRPGCEKPPTKSTLTEDPMEMKSSLTTSYAHSPGGLPSTMSQSTEPAPSTPTTTSYKPNSLSKEPRHTKSNPFTSQPPTHPQRPRKPTTSTSKTFLPHQPHLTPAHTLPTQQQPPPQLSMNSGAL